MWLDPPSHNASLHTLNVSSTVATEGFLQGWNIALIVIGVVAFVIGDSIAAGLGTILAVKSVKLTGEWVTITTLANIRQQLSEYELLPQATHFPCNERVLLQICYNMYMWCELSLRIKTSILHSSATRDPVAQW